MDLFALSFALDSLSVYRPVLEENPAAKALYRLLSTLNTDRAATPHLLLRQYAALSKELYTEQRSLPDSIYKSILHCHNPLAEAAAKGREEEVVGLCFAAKRDLQVLWEASRIPPRVLAKEICRRAPKLAGLPLSEYDARPKTAPDGDWGDELQNIIDYHRKNGCGMFAEHAAFVYESDRTLKPVLHRDPIRLSDLKHYELQRHQAEENTRALLYGHPFQNILFYGDRGTGKSSTVKALLNEYAPQGLRMIQVSKESLFTLGELMGRLAGESCKFIIFLDDLTFEEDDDSFGALKAVLEGGLSSRPNNMAIYATTNRRHLIKETFTARSGSEVHRSDTVDEISSLSDRFGLYLTYTSPNKDGYLDIVSQLAADRGIELPEKELLSGAEQFALRKGNRSPRLARQYVDSVQARLALAKGDSK